MGGQVVQPVDDETARALAESADDRLQQTLREQRLTPAAPERLFVRNDAGELVQLGNGVATDTGAGPNRIARFQRLRSTAIGGAPLGTATERAEALLAKTLPAGFGFDWRGEAGDLHESSAASCFFGMLAIVVVDMVWRRNSGASSIPSPACPPCRSPSPAHSAPCTRTTASTCGLPAGCTSSVRMACCVSAG